ncbi:hypothetical protein P7K49_029518 [Saguinus oedipus]|uniref:Uncharacterized protein n=1 Tax=Saguinus oedipus TaxID=9490 RepID=A0ABQ9U7F0_SAGOE|nr:hypothetical protein P7K49_029518 [Saguinus oedipus]
MLRALTESGAGMPEQDKDPRVQEKPDDQKGGPEGTRDARSAFRPLWDSGGLSPFVPRPGPLQRDLHTQRSEMPSDKKSQPSGMSCCRNSISSSYSSTGGFPWLKRGKGPASSHCRLPLTSSKTVTELGFRVTAEELDLEKKAEIMCLNSALQASRTDAQQERRKSQDGLDPVALQASAVGSPSRPPVSGRKRSQGTTAHSAAGTSLPTTSTSSPRTKRKSTWAADLAGSLPDPSSASLITAMARQRVSDFTLLQKLDAIATAITQPKPVVLHGRQQGTHGLKGTRTLKQVRPYSRPAASAVAQASSSAPTRPAQGTAAQSAAGVPLPTTSTWSLAGTLSNPSSASLITALARLTISGPTSLLKLAVTAAATTQPKPVVLHGQQQGTRGLKWARPYSDPAA